jgi:glycosyltransferase involved in cell wall biosynthesis
MEKTTPKISVLIPAYNVEKYVDEAVESILKQTFQDFEIIIIDDCSTDSTWEVLQKYRENSKVHLFKNELNMGISRTRNKLISLAHPAAKYIVWQDSDDISFPYRLKEQYAFMEANPEVGISSGSLQFFDETGDLSVREYFPDDARARSAIFHYSPVTQGAAIIRKECFAITGIFPMASPVAEDLAMSFQIGTKYKFGNLQKILVRYRQTPTNVTHTKLRTMEMYSVFLRYIYSKNPAYKMSLFDKLYNVASYLSIFLIPTKTKIALFNLIRNKRAN